jgi:hypothetical protein
VERFFVRVGPQVDSVVFVFINISISLPSRQPQWERDLFLLDR